MSRCASNDISFGRLPEDVIYTIFNFLPLQEAVNASLVCSTWHNAIRDPRLFEFLTFSKSHSSNYVRTCLFKAANVKSVSFIKCTRSHDIFCEASFCEALKRGSCRKLELLDSSISGAHLSGMLEVFHNLSYISFADSSQLITTDILQCLSTSNVSLISLNLSYCCSMSDDDLVKIADSFESLVELNIEGNPYVTDDGVSYFLKKRGSGITSLCLDGENLSDQFTRFLHLTTQLKEFSVAYAENLSSFGFCIILSSLKCLEVLRFHKVCNLIDSEVARAFKESIWLRGIKHLELDDCQNLGDETALSLSEICVNVTYLSMDWWPDLTDVGVRAIICNCSHLQYWSVVGAHRLVGLSSFDQNLKVLMPILRELRLEKCHSFNDSLFSAMLNYLPRLKIVNYYGEPIIKAINESELL